MYTITKAMDSTGWLFLVRDWKMSPGDCLACNEDFVTYSGTRENADGVARSLRRAQARGKEALGEELEYHMRSRQAIADGGVLWD